MIAQLFQELSHGINWQEVDQSLAPQQSTQEELRILMVTPRYYPQRGRLEHHVQQVAQRLVHAGHDVTILTSSSHRRFAYQEQVAGVKIQRVAEGLEETTYDAALDLYNTIRYGQWDIVHLQSSHTMIGLLGMYGAWQARIPYVVTLHGGDYASDPHHPLYNVQHEFLSPLLGRAARLIAPTQFAIDYYSQRLQLPRERFSLIPNGADTEGHTGRCAAEHEVVITALGRTESTLGQHRMIAAMPHILDHYPQARLHILGENLNQTVLKQQALVLGVANHVEITAIPAFNESTLEAMMADTTVITTWGQDHPYVTALVAAMSPKPAVLIGAGNLPVDSPPQAEQVRLVDTTSTPQELATAVMDQVYCAFTEARRYLPTWDACVDELLALYHHLAVPLWKPHVQESAQFN